jgi:single-strand DNA-binding protein
MSLNKVMIIGRLGQDPELKYTPNGSAVCNFSLATSESWTDKNNGQKQEKTEWHRVTTWGKTAEICGKYLAKGKQCYVEGKLQTRSWDAQDGSKRYTTEIIATAVQFLGSSQERAAVDGASYDSSSANLNSSNPFSHSDDMNSSSQSGFDSGFSSDDIPF